MKQNLASSQHVQDSNGESISRIVLLLLTTVCCMNAKLSTADDVNALTRLYQPDG